MINISEKTLTDLEFPTVRKQLSEFCVTQMGIEKVKNIRPFKYPQQILFALNQTQEYKSSAYQDQQIPQHGFEEVQEEIRLLGINNSTLELRSLRNIATLSETANAHLRFFKKNKELYPNLYKNTEEIEYTNVITDKINQVIDRFGEIKNDASPLLQKIRQSLNQLQAKIDSSFITDLKRYQAAGYLDEIRESVLDNKRVLAVSSKVGS